MARRCDGAKRDDWRKRLARFDTSNLTVAEFCRAEQVSLASYYYWSRRFRESSTSVAPPIDQAGQKRADQLTQQVVPPATIEVWLPDGVRVVVPARCAEALPLVLQSACQLSMSSQGDRQTPAFQQVVLDTQ